MSGHVLFRSKQMRSQVISSHWHVHAKRQCLKYMGHMGYDVGHSRYSSQSRLKRKNRLTHSNLKVLRAQRVTCMTLLTLLSVYARMCTPREREAYTFHFQHLWTIKTSGSTRPSAMAEAACPCSRLPISSFPWASCLQP